MLLLNIKFEKNTIVCMLRVDVLHKRYIIFWCFLNIVSKNENNTNRVFEREKKR